MQLVVKTLTASMLLAWGACAQAALFALLLTGCSAMIAGSGKHSDVLQLNSYREDVLRTVGKPLSTEFGVKPEGQQAEADCLIDTYIIKGKKPDPERANEDAALGLFTIYLSEIILTPVELARAARASLKTHRVRLTYCPYQGRMILSRRPDYQDIEP